MQEQWRYYNEQLLISQCGGSPVRFNTKTGMLCIVKCAGSSFLTSISTGLRGVWTMLSIAIEKAIIYYVYNGDDLLFCFISTLLVLGDII